MGRPTLDLMKAFGCLSKSIGGYRTEGAREAE